MPPRDAPIRVPPRQRIRIYHPGVLILGLGHGLHVAETRRPSSRSYNASRHRAAAPRAAGPPGPL
eukprot:15147899-Alexandrium_andersonii.AAC.1